ncbi:type II toxin-antitoxin system death-on-curing family toxin [Marinobacter guineae]|uniref:type II toxin-antitoxin system death-on-curing family toxin n=1 Tax=Marinobacter guineae TaxID=432303 RepID=UPI0014748D65|nr:type II toxin-antitoxin system death-on-curing family toxin [Marinobacter guineae]
MEVRYLTAEQVRTLHDEQIDLYTPAEQKHVADWGSLESACSRPGVTRYYDQESDIFDLAASLGFGLAKNHAFANANKRTAAISTHVFLLINGYQLEISQWQLVDIFEKLANDLVDQESLAQILDDYSRELSDEERADLGEQLRLIF